MLTTEFDYHLPDSLIAQRPLAERDSSRLMVLDRQTGGMSHRRFHDLPALLRSGDLLVLNNSKVIPARLRGLNRITGGRFDLLLVEQNGPTDWWAMLKPGRRARLNAEIAILDRTGAPTGVVAQVMEINAEGHRRLRFSGTLDLATTIARVGETPLPPYIRRRGGKDLEDDGKRYQTVYAQPEGSLAAPTAGLHFTARLLGAIRAAGVACVHVTLHVGLGTFAPVKAEDLRDHLMHEERFDVSTEAAQQINAARAEGRRVIAVGTTTLRVLESLAAVNEGRIMAGPGRTCLFIYPPADFRVVDALITNFHLPRSTLLMLVSAFLTPGASAGREKLLQAYGEAIRTGYRFFSYGDAMLIT